MKNSIKKIIRYVLKDLNMYSEDAENLVYRTGMSESNYKHLEQVKGPALGFFQVEPDTINDGFYNRIDSR